MSSVSSGTAGGESFCLAVGEKELGGVTGNRSTVEAKAIRLFDADDNFRGAKDRL